MFEDEEPTEPRGEAETVDRFKRMQKMHGAKRILAKAQLGCPKRERVITTKDIVNLIIDINTKDLVDVVNES